MPATVKAVTHALIRLRNRSIMDFDTVGAHARKHPASLQGTLGFSASDDFTNGNVRFLGPKSIDLLGVQGWVSCGGFLVAEPPL